MEELLRSLMDCLKQEAEIYRRMAALANRQKDLLVAGKTEDLPENVRLEEKEVFALGPIVGRRNELLAQMAKVHQVKTLTLGEALQKAPAGQAESLKAAIVELVRSAKELETLNQNNEKLLGNSLSFVNFTLNLIRNGGRTKSFSPMKAAENAKPAFVNRVV